MAVTRTDVLKVAQLARLTLSEEEVELFTRQLGQIVGYIEQLSELDVSGVEPLAHPLPLSNVFRDDRVRPSLSVEEAVGGAPRRHEDFFVVPPTLE